MARSSEQRPRGRGLYEWGRHGPARLRTMVRHPALETSMMSVGATCRFAGAAATCFVLVAAVASAAGAAAADESAGFNPGGPAAPGSEWVQAITIKSPELRSEVKGD